MDTIDVDKMHAKPMRTMYDLVVNCPPLIWQSWWGVWNTWFWIGVLYLGTSRKPSL